MTLRFAQGLLKTKITTVSQLKIDLKFSQNLQLFQGNRILITEFMKKGC